MKLILSSSNPDKIEEIQRILGDEYEVVLKSDLGLEDFDVEETGETLRENAYLKAKALYDKVKENIIADDSGLFVEALDFRPGVYSARYAGEHATYDDNNTKLLEELKEVTNLNDRRAYFMTTICFISKSGEVYYAEGKLDGYITTERRGTNGFGYNPLFLVKNTNKTLAEMDDLERLSINHRSKAIENLKQILEEIK
ncbi:RdgB/HAM1 family non-canonical purine NTP pyrophosphatase [Helcococcus kunzii]|uniref:RdgB/HAM1 family non-canonical purine NTP pyrophosphatase n=1 Tax=Helcococcus kunzii TaxID=40091 RepID=UPI0038A31878